MARFYDRFLIPLASLTSRMSASSIVSPSSIPPQGKS
jgi:hypothetical protein